MSKINRKTSLALALTAAFMLAGSALANGAPTARMTGSTLVANLDIVNSSTNVTVSPLDINILTSDLIIGRTTGFSVRLKLEDGAQFAVPVPANPVFDGGALGSGTTAWTASVAAGGQAGDDYVVYSVQPGANSVGVVNGTALEFIGNPTPGALRIKNVGGLATAGSSVHATVTFADPNTAQPILVPDTEAIITSADPLKYTFDTTVNQAKRVDVGSAVFASKTSFSPDGSLNNSGDVHYFNAGKLNVGVVPGVDNSSNFGFAWTGFDHLKLVLDGKFTAFDQQGAKVTLNSNANCGSGTDISGAVGTFNGTDTLVTFDNVTYTSLSAGSAYVCFTVPNDNAAVIDATSVGTTATMTRGVSGLTSSKTAAAQAIQYNGPVAVVYTFNPAGNTMQESFLRISNTGGSDGKVTIVARDDAGNEAGPVSFNLAAATSIQLTSSDLQNGNPGKGLSGYLGAGAGKWILTVTGEISGMEVTNLNRNNTSGTVSNLGTPVSDAGVAHPQLH